MPMINRMRLSMESAIVRYCNSCVLLAWLLLIIHRVKPQENEKKSTRAAVITNTITPFLLRLSEPIRRPPVMLTKMTILLLTHIDGNWEMSRMK
jgi:hypothetical protein